MENRGYTENEPREAWDVLMSRLFANRTHGRVEPAKDVRGGVAPSAASGMPGQGDLSKLTRVQLLELLKDAVEENERLKKELAETKQQLEDKRIAIDDSESLAEASLRLAGMFAAAQKAIDLYGWNVSVQRDGNVSSANGEGGEAAPADASVWDEAEGEGGAREALELSPADAPSSAEDSATSKKGAGAV